ncbi:MAG: thymidine phosphorylase, partial [Acidobacteria bacterium]|nr:thymidine phosphorylase [Acidobacteriota bacterium]
KHSTGGVGDKVSLVLSPLLAACDLPVVMLTGRGLGHTGGTADKLEAIPGLDLELDRARTLRLLDEVSMAVGVATADIAPADRKLYALRDVTGTVESLPLITASILSKKLATGAAGIVYDLKTGSGAFLPTLEEGQRLAEMLVRTSIALGTPARAILTDMNQPLGRWAGHACEVQETLDALEGRGPEDLMEVTYALCLELAEILGRPLNREDLDRAIATGTARERFDRWMLAQGADPAWVKKPELPLAPEILPIKADRTGKLAAASTKQLGFLLGESGGGRRVPGDQIDHGVSLEILHRIGDEVRPGDELARFHLRKPDPTLASRATACFQIADDATAPPLIVGRVE